MVGPREEALTLNSGAGIAQVFVKDKEPYRLIL
jgi:hypothetical protein